MLGHVVFVISEDWYFWSHRLPLAKAAVAEGYRVTLVTRTSTLKQMIEEEGIDVIPFECPRRSVNPFRNLLVVFRLARILRSLKPDIVHNVSLKNIVLGTFAARFAGSPHVVNAFAGLGYAFVATGWRAKILRACICLLLRICFYGLRARVIVQNLSDRDILVSSGIVRSCDVSLVRGAGVDVESFQLLPEPPEFGLVVMPCRMLWSKGVQQFVEAAFALQTQGIRNRFVLVGRVDEENPDHVPESRLREWHRRGVVEWWDHQPDIQAVFTKAQLVCLPSFYGEGLPKVLLEAAACGRAIVTTDIAGCREICREGLNGWLIPIKDSEALAQAIRDALDRPLICRAYGRRGRRLVEQEFTSTLIAAQTIEIYRSLNQTRDTATAIKNAA